MTFSEFRLSLFTELVNTEFEVLDDPASSFSLVLTAIVEHASTARNEAFSLFFHGPAERFLPQSSHRLKHASLGELELFLVPVAQEKDGFQYEAVFNLLL